MSEKFEGPEGTSKRPHQVQVIRHGRDEMNLAEYPFASLWKNTELGSEILHEWETTHPRTGKIVKAFWRVTGDPQLGLPTARDEQLYLVLMELTHEAGLKSPIVHFTRHDLISRLGWSHCQRDYDTLRDGFTRLKAVTITSQNAFWDARSRSFRITGDGLIDSFNILQEELGRKSARQSPVPQSFFKWNDLMFDSFQAGYLKSLDLTFAQSLNSPLALRLYRYLDKKAFKGRRCFEVELTALCERHLGMRTSPYPSKHKERLRPAHEELIARGFLQNVEYEPMKTKNGEKVRYAFASRHRQRVEDLAPEPLLEPAVVTPAPETITASGAAGPALLELPPGRDSAASTLAPEQEELLGRMLCLKVSPAVAQIFLQDASEEELRLQLDCLEDREPRDPAATFVQAVRGRWELPSKYLERQEAQERAKRAQTAQESNQALKAAQRASKGLLRASLQREEAQLDILWEKMTTEERERLDSEAHIRLGVLGRMGGAQGALRAMRRNLMREQGLIAKPVEAGS